MQYETEFYRYKGLFVYQATRARHHGATLPRQATPPGPAGLHQRKELHSQRRGSSAEGRQYHCL